MIDREHDLPISKQAQVLHISRGSVYYLPRPVPATDLEVMRRLDRLHLEFPFAGSRMLQGLLVAEGCKIGRRHVKTLMKRMEIEALYRRPRTTKPEPGRRAPSPSLALREERARFAECTLHGVVFTKIKWVPPTLQPEARQLEGYGLTTANILYRRPDHPWLLQTYVWQDYDLCPMFPHLNKFLNFWMEKLEGPLHSVTVAHARLIKPAEIRAPATDRHGRRPQGHQPFDLRSAASARHSRGVGNAAL
jgi:uncharacterized protein Usg